MLLKSVTTIAILCHIFIYSLVFAKLLTDPYENFQVQRNKRLTASLLNERAYLVHPPFEIINELRADGSQNLEQVSFLTSVDLNSIFVADHAKEPEIVTESQASPASSVIDPAEDYQNITIDVESKINTTDFIEADSWQTQIHVPSNIQILCLFVVIIVGLVGYIIRHELRFLITNHINKYLEGLEKTALRLYREGQHSRVIQLVQTNLSYLHHFRGKRHVDTISFQHLAAKSHLAMKHIDEAERVLSLVRDVYEPLGRDIHLANVMEDIGRLNFLKSQWDEALQHFLASLDIYVDLLSQDDEDSRLKDITVSPISLSKPSPREFWSNYERHYRHELTKKAYLAAKLTPRRNSTGRSPEALNNFDMSPSTKNQILFISPYQQQRRESISVKEAFDLEADEEQTLNEFEKLLQSPVLSNSPTTTAASSPELGGLDLPEGRAVSVYVLATADTARLHHNIARVLARQKKYNQSLEYYGVAVDMYMNMEGRWDVVIAKIYEEVKHFYDFCDGQMAPWSGETDQQVFGNENDGKISKSSPKKTKRKSFRMRSNLK